MLPLGHIGIRAEIGDDRMCSLTWEEQRTLMTLFAVCRSPLMLGGNLPDSDSHTLALITNKEMLYINQHSTNNRQLFRDGDIIAWTADDPVTGDKYLALFNAQDADDESTTDTVSVDLSLLGTGDEYTVTDLWEGSSLGACKEAFAMQIKRHDAGLFRLSEARRQ